jgi:hypothetical protein
MPETGVTDAMRSAMFTKEDIADLRMWRFLQRALPGGSIKALKTYVAGLHRPTRLVDDATIVANVETTIVHVKRTPPVTVNAVVNAEPRTMRQSMTVSSATQATAKRKARNMRFYKNKKARVHSSSPAAITTTTTTMTTTTTAMTMAAIAAVAPWSIRANGAACTLAAMRMAKMWCVKPTVDKIVDAGNKIDQATMIRAVVDHPALVAARALAGILSTKEQAVASYVSKQTARMLGRARSNVKVRGKSKREKRDATEVVMSFSAPLPTRPSTNRETVVPSQRDCAKLFRIPRSTLQRVNGAMITKRQQLTAGERGIYWVLAKTKRGYSTISNEMKSILLDAFNNHPHVVVSPNTKDTFQVKNADGEKVLVRKILTMVGLGTILSDIVRDHPTIKNKVGEHAFWYIVSGLGCVRRFTDSHKTMCGCTECVGLHTLHHSLQAKRSIMARQIAIDVQRCTTKARAEEMARG